MRLLQRFSRGELGLTRIEAFSDGVFAIVVTLLVLELKVPELHDPNNPQELGQQLVALLPKFLSWLISFIIVCKFWLNSLFLMFQSFIPFPTAMMGEHPANPLAVSLFGVVMAVNTVMFMVLQG